MNEGGGAAIRLLVVSTARNTDAILSRLARRPDVGVALHFGGGDAHYKGRALTRMETGAGRRGDLMPTARQPIRRDPRQHRGTPRL
ncbi:hypothetical protein, partial [Jannaschia sp. LMIT008]|uniref:hypothetical protein n=1 Tax=Jannaschia maritima TaxID=3032585 RepID=UPI002811DC20